MKHRKRKKEKKELFRGDYSGQEFDLLGCQYIDEGHNGVIYRMQDGRILKIYKDIEEGIREYIILKSVKGNKYFPKVYECGENYMIRDYVEGKSLKDYIRRHGPSEEIIRKVVELLEEFKRLRFTKIDIRCKDIFVKKDGSLVVIDPKSVYTKVKKYPHRLMIGLSKVGALETFKQVLKEEKPDLYHRWIALGRDLEEIDD